MSSDIPEAVNQAIQTLELTLPLTRERLEARRRELFLLWHPPRYAGLTNNPHKYMEMYKKGELMTKRVDAAYQILLAWLATQEREP